MNEEKFIEHLQKLPSPYLTFVWAEDQNQLIGKDGDLPWSLPAEMKYFKEVTTNGVVIMGRKTYESIPNPPLKNRINIILTKNKDYKKDGAIICHSKEEVLAYLEKQKINKPIHVIGGPAIFKLFIDEVNILYRTIVEDEFTGDTYMPKIDYQNFICIKNSSGIVDEKNKYPHHFYVYERKELVSLF